MPSRFFTLVPHRAEYPFDAVVSGAKALGYEVRHGFAGEHRPQDVLATWHPYPAREMLGRRHEAVGGKWLVLENGYIGEDHFAVGLGGFNGDGDCRVPRPCPRDRFDDLGVRVEPWRTEGDHILVVGQMGGAHRWTCPRHWPAEVITRLRRITTRPIIYRPHPKRLIPVDNVRTVDPRTGPIERDLENAHAVVVWTSNSATRSLLAGVPVFYEGPSIIMKGASQVGLTDIEKPRELEREAAFAELAYCQGSISEIASGAAFARLLKD